MLLSAVSFLVVAQSSSEVPEGITLYIYIYIYIYGIFILVATFLFFYVQCDFGPIGRKHVRTSLVTICCYELRIGYSWVTVRFVYSKASKVYEF